MQPTPGAGPLPPWPATIAELEAEQREFAAATPPRWTWPELHGERRSGASITAPTIGGCFVCFPRGGGGAGAAGDPGWSAAVLWRGDRVLEIATASGSAGAAYDPGHLALREGPLLEAALLRLPRLPDVLLVDATGRDHPRRAGLALHLGARLGIPTVGVTNRLLVAIGAEPEAAPGARRAFCLGSETVGWWLRARRGTRPLAVHVGWRTDPETALAVVLECTRGARTPAPLRWARRAAREARARAHP